MKENRTKYSKFNKRVNKLIYNMGNGHLSNQIKSAIGNLSDMACMNSIKSFSDFGYENIFIETEELYNFLRDTKIITHGDIPAQLYMAILNRRYTQLEKLDTIDGIKELRTYNFMIYAPTSVINTALAVTLYTTNKQMECPKTEDKFLSKEKLLQNKQNWDHLLKNSLCWADNLKSYYITLTEKTFSEDFKKGWPKENISDFQVIINLLFYMNAFPDYVHEGVPKRAVLDSEIFHKKRITIYPNVAFFEKLKMMPHLRRGHFRTYSSDYFVNMKGKTAWIEPVFVKGQSITVEDGISM